MRKTLEILILEHEHSLYLLVFPTQTKRNFMTRDRPDGRIIDRREVAPSGISPETSEIVEIAGVAVEKMNDEIAVIEQHPLGGVVAFDADRAAIRARFELFVDLVSDRLNLPLVRAACDNEKFGKAGELAQIEPDDVERLFVGGTCDRELDFRVQVRRRRGR